MSEEIVSDSQIETVEEEQNEEVKNAFEMFGITQQKEETKAPESEEDQSPAKETDSKKLKVKFNKEDVEIDEDKIPELVQKGLGLDKERERKSELEKTLDRVAKLAGYDNNADYIANLDKLEQQQQQKKQDDFDKLKSDMRQEFIDNGFDPDKVDAYIETHPLMQKAREAVLKDEERSVQETLTKTQEQNQKAWQELYKEFPDIVESSQAFNEGKEPEWYNAEMKSRITKGYDPVDAYRLAHMSTIQTQTKKAAEQKAIKDVMLGNRSQVETVQSTDTEPHVPEALTSAFSMFGLNPKSAKKYVK